MNALDDFMMKILIVCSIFSIVVDYINHEPENIAPFWVEGSAILIAVAVVTLVGASQDYSKEGEFLNNQKAEEATKNVTVKRDSKEQLLHKNFIKVGDVIRIDNGMNIPVDGIVVQGVGIMADESAMTGESDHLSKEAFHRCMLRKEEHEGDKGSSRTPHDVPSPILLSGT